MTKFWLVENVDNTEIVESAESPKIGPPMITRTIGYDTKEDLIKCEGIPETPCVECNRIFDTAKYSERTRKRMIERNLCCNCDFWMCEVTKKSYDVIVDHQMYKLGSENSDSFRGFGGSKFIFEKLDGTIIHSTNVWHLGSIPVHFRDRLPDNATRIIGREPLRFVLE